MKLASIIALIVLMAGIALQFRGCAMEPDPVPPPLAETISASTAGWTAEDMAIAETEEMKRAVGELLNFDDAIFRSYRKGGWQFDVYAAYWRPGKMSERLVAGHSPDVCWVAAGWKPLSREAPAERNWAAEGAQYRVFGDNAGRPRNVVFWHVSGGRAVDYGGGVPPWWTIFSDLKTHGLKQRRSQYFVRVSANVPWDELVADAGFFEVMRSVRSLLEPRDQEP